MAVAQAAGRCLGPSTPVVVQPASNSVGRQIAQPMPQAVLPVLRHPFTRTSHQVVFSKTTSSSFLGQELSHRFPFDSRKGGRGALCTSASAGVADEQGEFQGIHGAAFGSEMAVPQMAKGLGSFGGATLERSKLDLSQKSMQRNIQTEDGGGGGDNGGSIKNGGGDGGDDGGDDDEYNDMGGDGDDGDDGGFFSRRALIPELFDRAAIEAVMQEWYRTLVDLPAGLRMAVEMGLVSSGQVARFLSLNARPTVARAVSRVAPDSVSRGFIGRMMADPAFLYKLALEQTITIGSAVHWEVQQRGSRLKDEWDLALINVAALSACNFAIMWATCPSRAFGTTFKYDWQNTLQKLPNNVFDKSYPLREFNNAKRVQGFLYKCAEMSAAGMGVGAVAGAVQNAMLNIRTKLNPNYRPAVGVPSISNSALGYGAFLGLSCNIRYQLLGGLDRIMYQQLNNLGLVVFTSSLLRVLNSRVGEPTRLAWLGIGEGSGSVYKRPSAAKTESFSLATWLKQHAQKRRTKVAESKASEEAAQKEATEKPERRAQGSRYRVRSKEELGRGAGRPRRYAAAGSSN